jgi:hypothetical protein
VPAPLLLQVTTKSFAFPSKNGLPFHFVSAADGTNVVKVFNDAVEAAWRYKHGEKDFVAEVLELLNEDTLGSMAAATAPSVGGGSSSRSADGEAADARAAAGTAGVAFAGSGGAAAMPAPPAAGPVGARAVDGGLAGAAAGVNGKALGTSAGAGQGRQGASLVGNGGAAAAAGGAGR